MGRSEFHVRARRPTAPLPPSARTAAVRLHGNAASSARGSHGKPTPIRARTYWPAAAWSRPRGSAGVSPPPVGGRVRDPYHLVASCQDVGRAASRFWCRSLGERARRPPEGGGGSLGSGPGAGDAAAAAGRPSVRQQLFDIAMHAKSAVVVENVQPCPWNLSNVHGPRQCSSANCTTTKI
eukprot:SAG22_NODE_1868_length_3404_cov_67.845688_6_plen_180_part_00